MQDRNQESLTGVRADLQITNPGRRCLIDGVTVLLTGARGQHNIVQADLAPDFFATLSLKHNLKNGK